MKKLLIVFAVFIFSLFLLPSSVFADIGRKPSVKFDITYDGQSLHDDFEAVLLVCESGMVDSKIAGPSGDFEHSIHIYDEDRDCTWLAHSFSEGFLRCENSTCSYNYFLNIPTDVRLAVKTDEQADLLISDVISVTQFDSYYVVEFSQDGSSETEELLVRLSGSQLSYFGIMLSVSIITEMIIAGALLLLFKNKSKRNILFTYFFVNLFTLSVLWIGLPALPVAFSFILFLVFELFVPVIEGAAIYILNRKYISIVHTSVIVIIANLVTFGMTFFSFMLMR